MVEKIGKYNKATEPTSFGRFEAELVNKVSLYCTNSGINRTDFITNLIERELEGKLLTNDFIELKKPLYIHRTGLISKLYRKKRNRKSRLSTIDPTKTAKATDVKPDDLNEYLYTYVIKKVPNNLDVFSKEYGKYCYNNNPNLHKGIYLYKEMVILNNNNYDVKPSFLLFEYNEASEKVTIEEAEELTTLLFKIDLKNNEQKELIQDLEKEYLDINEWINKDLFEDNILELQYLPSLQVIENLFTKEANEKFNLNTVDTEDNIDSVLHLNDNNIITFEDMIIYFQL